VPVDVLTLHIAARSAADFAVAGAHREVAVPGVVAESSLPVSFDGHVVGVVDIEVREALSRTDITIAGQVVAASEQRLADLGGPDIESLWQRLAHRSTELAELDDAVDIRCEHAQGLLCSHPVEASALPDVVVGLDTALRLGGGRGRPTFAHPRILVNSASIAADGPA
jgi:hypothetical protein